MGERGLSLSLKEVSLKHLRPRHEYPDGYSRRSSDPLPLGAIVMGGRNQTTWQKGQSGNPRGRQTPEEHAVMSGDSVVLKVAKEHGLAPVGAVEGGDGRPLSPARPVPKPSAGYRKFFEDALEALSLKALMRVEKDLNYGGDKASQQARYVLDQRFGKATETVKQVGEGHTVKVVLEYVDKKLVLPPSPRSDPTLGSNSGDGTPEPRK